MKVKISAKDSFSLQPAYGVEPVPISISVQAATSPAYDIPINVSATHTQANPKKARKSQKKKHSEKEGEHAKFFSEREYCREQFQAMIGCL